MGNSFKKAMKPFWKEEKKLKEIEDIMKKLIESFREYYIRKDQVSSNASSFSNMESWVKKNVVMKFEELRKMNNGYSEDLLKRVEELNGRINKFHPEIARKEEKSKKRGISDFSAPPDEVEEKVSSSQPREKTKLDLEIDRLLEDKEKFIKFVNRVYDVLKEEKTKLENWSNHSERINDGVVKLREVEDQQKKYTEKIILDMKKCEDQLDDIKKKLEPFRHPSKPSALNFFKYLKNIKDLGKPVLPVLEKQVSISKKLLDLRSMKKEYEKNWKFIESEEILKDDLTRIYLVRFEEIDKACLVNSLKKALYNAFSAFYPALDYDEQGKTFMDIHTGYNQIFVLLNNGVKNLVQKNIGDLKEIMNKDFATLERGKYLSSIVIKGKETEKLMDEFWTEISKNATRNLFSLLQKVDDFMMETKAEKKSSTHVFVEQFVDFGKGCILELSKFKIGIGAFEKYCEQVCNETFEYIQKQLKSRNGEFYNLKERIQNNFRNKGALEKGNTKNVFSATSNFFKTAATLRNGIEEYLYAARKFIVYEKIRKCITTTNRPSKITEEIQKVNDLSFVLKNIRGLFLELENYENQKFKEKFAESEMMYDEKVRDFTKHFYKTKDILIQNQSRFHEKYEFWSRFGQELTNLIEKKNLIWEEQIKWIEKQHDKANSCLQKLNNRRNPSVIERAAIEYLKNYNQIIVILRNHAHEFYYKLLSTRTSTNKEIFVGESNVRKNRRDGAAVELKEEDGVKSIFCSHYEDSVRKGHGIQFIEDFENVSGIWEGEKCIVRSIQAKQQIHNMEVLANNSILQCWVGDYYKFSNTTTPQVVFIRKFKKLGSHNIIEKVTKETKELQILRVIGIVNAGNDSSLADAVVLQFVNQNMENLVIKMMGKKERSGSKQIQLYGINTSSNVKSPKDNIKEFLDTLPMKGFERWTYLAKLVRDEIGPWLGNSVSDRMMRVLKEACSESCPEKLLDELRLIAIVRSFEQLTDLFQRMQDERRGMRISMNDVLGSQRREIKTIIDGLKAKCEKIKTDFNAIKRSRKGDFLEFTGLGETIKKLEVDLQRHENKFNRIMREEQKLLMMMKEMLPLFRNILSECDILRKITIDIVQRNKDLESALNNIRWGGIDPVKRRVNDFVGCQRAYKGRIGYLNTAIRNFYNKKQTIMKLTGWGIHEDINFDDVLRQNRNQSSNFEDAANQISGTIEKQLRDAGQWWSCSPSYYSIPSADKEIQNIGKRLITRLEIACLSMNKFVENFHVQGKDRCCVAKFGSTYHLLQDYRTEEVSIRLTIALILKQGVSGSTRLYYSMQDFANHLERNKRPDTPVVLIAVTDGDDTTELRRNLPKVGRMLKDFSDQPLHFCYLMGVGQGIDESSMKKVMEMAKGEYIGVKDFGKLQAAFLLLSLQIQEVVQVRLMEIGVKTNEGNVSIEAMSVSKGHQLGKRGIDYGILLDISGSMDAKVDLDELD